MLAQTSSRPGLRYFPVLSPGPWNSCFGPHAGPSPWSSDFRHPSAIAPTPSRTHPAQQRPIEWRRCLQRHEVADTGQFQPARARLRGAHRPLPGRRAQAVAGAADQQQGPREGCQCRAAVGPPGSPGKLCERGAPRCAPTQTQGPAGEAAESAGSDAEAVGSCPCCLRLAGFGCSWVNLGSLWVRL